MTICVSLADMSVERCAEALRTFSCCELRLDLLPSIDELLPYLPECNTLIATFRPTPSISTADRVRALTLAIANGATYVDIDINDDRSLLEDVISRARAASVSIIISSHNFNDTPEYPVLRSLVDRCFDAGADVAKIACTPHTNSDLARLLGLLDSQRKLIVIGMGTYGRFSRVAAPLLGSLFAYASLDDAHMTAPGQFSVQELSALLSQFRHL